MRGDITVDGDLLAVLRGFHRSQTVAPAWLARFNRARNWLPVSVSANVRNARRHYDIGNDFYRLWLDGTRTYTCAYFPGGDETLEEAQFKKRELICQKLRLQPGQTLLDIGCGWGSLMFHAIEHYGVRATGVTPAKEQAAYITEQARARHISHLVNVVPREWREIHGTFDRIVSVGMFEQVRPYHYGHFFEKWRRLLVPDGISLLHTITHRHRVSSDPWLSRYIFPGGVLSPQTLISRHAAQAGLVSYRSENLKPHYGKTLAHWSHNFAAAREEVVKMFDEQFARMWWFYLQACEAGFRWGNLELWQFELYGPAAPLRLSRELTKKTK